jgi:hypothetical protein
MASPPLRTVVASGRRENSDIKVFLGTSAAVAGCDAANFGGM